MRLSVPSVVLAEATWYGSLRGGIEFGGDDDARFKDGGSRWGIKGSSEVSEGLNAVYRFEHKIDTSNASQPGGRLAYAGFSGGFGTVTLGQVWSASFNSTGAITDNSWFYGDSHTSYRVGNALSYGISVGSVDMQVDAIMDGAKRTDKGVDQVEFGLTVGLGDVGKLAFAHVSKEDELHDVTTMGSAAVQRVNIADAGADPEWVEVTQVMVRVAEDDTANVTDGKVNSTGDDLVQRNPDGSYSIGTCDAAEDSEEANKCTTATVWVSSVTSINTIGTGGGLDTTTTTIDYYAKPDEDGMIPAVPSKTKTEVKKDAEGKALVGSTANHVAFQMGLGGVTGHLGYSEIKKNGADDKDKITHYGVAGGVGDTGISYLLQARNKKLADGTKKSPWLLAVTRSLGGGATVMVEHANNDDDKSGNTRVGVKVDF